MYKTVSKLGNSGFYRAGLMSTERENYDITVTDTVQDLTSTVST